MAGSTARSSASEEPPLLSIGQVLARLTHEFPDLTPSKLRFLEERDLVRPARTESGYRKYSPADVDRVRFVLTMQRDHYRPLKVIRQMLEDLDAGREPELLPASAPIPSMLSTERRLQREELLRETGASPALLHEAIASSLIAPGEWFGEDALRVLTALVELSRVGIEPRHLRGFRAAAEREVGLIESALLPASRRGDSAARARVQDMAREIAGQLETVRTSLIRGAIGRMGS